MYYLDRNAHQPEVRSSLASRHVTPETKTSCIFCFWRVFQALLHLPCQKVSDPKIKQFNTDSPASDILHPSRPNVRSLLIQILPLVHLLLHAHRRQQEQSPHGVHHIAFSLCGSEDDLVVVAPYCGCPVALVCVWRFLEAGGDDGGFEVGTEDAEVVCDGLGVGSGRGWEKRVEVQAIWLWKASICISSGKEAMLSYVDVHGSSCRCLFAGREDSTARVS